MWKSTVVCSHSSLILGLGDLKKTDLKIETTYYDAWSWILNQRYGIAATHDKIAE